MHARSGSGLTEKLTLVEHRAVRLDADEIVREMLAVPLDVRVHEGVDVLPVELGQRALIRHFTFSFSLLPAHGDLAATQAARASLGRSSRVAVAGMPSATQRCNAA